MLLTISTTIAPATDLGYLLHKHPARPQSTELAVGTAHVFYPEASDERCTAALLLEVDPIGLVRGRRGRQESGSSLAQYVNDRPYSASSLLAVAMARVFKTAMLGRCDARPELASTPLPLDVRLPSMPCRGGADVAERLFGPLGWQVSAAAIRLDRELPEWGDSSYVDLRLTGRLRLCDALNHLYVLLPVLDDAKHYWVGPDEVDKLVRAGAGWLHAHPDRTLISERYLKHQRALVDDATSRLLGADDERQTTVDSTSVDATPATGAMPLGQSRRAAVLEVLHEAGAATVVDWGCGEGALLADLVRAPQFTEIVGVDVSPRALAKAARRVRVDEMSDEQRSRTRLLQSSLTYRDDRLAGFDAAVLVEVIEHVDPQRTAALERCVFGAAHPKTVVVTTPNAEYNPRFSGLAAGQFRHPDHRFEWNRQQFRQWAHGVSGRYGYQVQFRSVGPDDVDVGAPTQLAVFMVVVGNAVPPDLSSTASIAAPVQGDR